MLSSMFATSFSSLEEGVSNFQKSQLAAVKVQVYASEIQPISSIPKVSVRKSRHAFHLAVNKIENAIFV